MKLRPVERGKKKGRGEGGERRTQEVVRDAFRLQLSPPEGRSRQIDEDEDSLFPSVGSYV